MNYSYKYLFKLNQFYIIVVFIKFNFIDISKYSLVITYLIIKILFTIVFWIKKEIICVENELYFNHI